jgi:hypothetical protein
MVPGDDNILNLISPQMEVDAVDFLKGLTQADDAFAKQYKTGRVKRVAGLMWAASQMTRRTRPARSSARGSSISRRRWRTARYRSRSMTSPPATGVVKLNDIVHLRRHERVPSDHEDRPGLEVPVRATADADSDGSGNVTLYFDGRRPLYFSGPLQNVTAQPTNNGTVYLFGAATTYASTTARQGLMWHKAALERVYIKLDDADGAGVAGKSMTEKNTGMSMRYTRQWDINIAKWKLRWDVWPAFKFMRPEWALRVMRRARKGPLIARWPACDRPRNTFQEHFR